MTDEDMAECRRKFDEVVRRNMQQEREMIERRWEHLKNDDDNRRRLQRTPGKDR